MVTGKKSAGAAVVWADRIPNPTRGEDRDSSVDDPRHRSAAAPRARGARARGDSLSRGSRGALDHLRVPQETYGFLAALAPPSQDRNPAHARTRNQLSATDDETCRRSRLTLSVVLDGEASAIEMAEAVRHLSGCEDCARFAAVVAELKRRLRTASPQRQGASKVLQRRRV